MKKNERSVPSLSAYVALSCLFSALLCAGAYISIPIPLGPIPLALSNFFAVLSGLLLGPLWGALSSALYVAVGALGFPVFSGGRGGIAHIAGPSGGYLAGYLVGAALAGLFAGKRSLVSSILGSVLGFAAILVLGAAGLRLLSGLTWGKALAVGILPFVPGDLIKVALASFIALRLGPFVDSLQSDRVRHA
jgi:biotin transport system substrate-specific component